MANTVGAGEGSFFVTEKFALHQISWNRRHIERDKRLFGSWTMLVKRSGNHFLTGAGFSGQKDGGFTVRKASDSAKNILHRARFTDYFGHLLLGRGFFGSVFFRSAADKLNRFINIKGLRKIFKSAALKT